MIIRRLGDCEEFISGDKALLRELLHSAKGDFKFGYSLAHATVKPAEATRPHKLVSSEVYYILEGQGLIYIDALNQPVTKDCVVYIAPHACQHIENTGVSDLKFLCIVDPAWKPEDEEII
ncbi:MAG: cupin domain-containing protein [Candidatus Omnitrophota bacterium]